MRYIFLLIIIAASIGTFVLVIKPRYDNIRTVKNEVATYDTSLETADKLKISREELIAKYNSIPKADLDGIKTLLPDSVDNIRLIIQLDSLATKNGLSTLRAVDYKTEDTNTSTGSSAPTSPASAGMPGGVGSNNTNAQMGSFGVVAKPYGELTVSFSTTGQYKNFLAFISDLEQNLRLVDVTMVDFSLLGGDTSGEQSTVSNLSYKVTLKTYWLKK